MGCLLALGGLLVPRFVLVALWLFSDYLNRAFESGWWAIVGFLFLPTTTIAYAIAQNSYSTRAGGIEAFGIIIVVLGVLVDLGLLGSGARGRGIGRRANA